MGGGWGVGGGGWEQQHTGRPRIGTLRSGFVQTYSANPEVSLKSLYFFIFSPGMWQSRFASYSSFSKRVHTHDLLLLRQVLTRAGRTPFPGEGPEVRTSRLLQSCTENSRAGSLSSFYRFWCFLVQKLGTPWVACRHLNSFLILWSL